MNNFYYLYGIKFIKIMEKTKFTVIFNRKSKLTQKGTAQIEISAFLNNKRKFFPTGIFVKPEEWDSKTRRIKSNVPHSGEMQRDINRQLEQLEQYEYDRHRSGKPFTLEYLQQCLQGKDYKYFTDFVENEIETDKVSARATLVNKRTIFKALREFQKNILFEEVNYEFLKNFENHLVCNGLSTNTINKYFRNLRTWVNTAINKDYMELNKYPFRKFKAPSKETTREYLEPSEIMRLENLEFSNENKHLQKIRDMFLFACYTGLRFSDISAISNDNIKQRDSGIYLEMIMQKTEQPIKLPLSLLNNGKPIELLQKYTSDNQYFFDNLTNQYVNRALKEIAELAGIDKYLTFHMARHSCATFLLFKRVPVTTVQKILGHKKLQTTQIYSKVMEQTMINDLEQIEW